MKIGYDKPLYVLPFDHRGSFSKNMFGWSGNLTAEQTAEIATVKKVIYDALKAAVAGGVSKDKAGILVDEQFGAAILRDARANGYITACPAEKSGQDEFDFEYGADFGKFFYQPVQKGSTDTLVNDLSSSEEYCRFNFVTLLQETDDVIFFDFVIMFIRVGSKLHFFDRYVFLMLLGFVKLLVHLVEVFSVIHDPANGRSRSGSYLYKIQPPLFSDF